MEKKIGGLSRIRSALPLVEECRLNLVLVAQVAYGHMLDEMLALDAHFLLGGEVTSVGFHFGLHSKPTLYSIFSVFPFPSGAKQDKMLLLVPKLRAATSEREKSALRNAVSATDRQIDRQIDELVYELYGLTPEEIAIVEGA